MIQPPMLMMIVRSYIVILPNIFNNTGNSHPPFQESLLNQVATTVTTAGRSLGKWRLHWQKDAPTHHEVVAEKPMVVPKRHQAAPLRRAGLCGDNDI